MRSLRNFVAALVLVLAPGSAARAEQTRYILAPSILQTDPAPDAFAMALAAEGRRVPGPTLAALNGILARRFDVAFPGLNRPLSVEAMLDPDQPTLVVVPRLSMVRLNRDTLAGSLDRFEAVVVGDISLMDPWTMTQLFAATRMAARTREVSVDKSPTERNAAIDQAFEAAAEAWIGDCLEEIKQNAHPFTLKGGILPSRFGAGPRGGGGFWPFGRMEGVKKPMTIMGLNGKRARVRELFAHFSVVENVAKPTSSMDAGEEYRVTLVGSDSPAERQEPRVAIAWIGPPPAIPAPGMRRPPSGAGWAGLFANYLSKSGGLRLLPVEESEGQEQWALLATYLKTFSTQTKDEHLEQDITAILAKGAPDLILEVGLAGAHHGSSLGEQGAVDHRFHLTWAVRWFARQQGSESAGGTDLVTFRGLQFQSEEKTVRTKEGLRDLDLSSVWFNLCRQGVIKLAMRLESSLHPPENLIQGVAQGSGKVAWSGPPPPSLTKLKWRRLRGMVRDPKGKELGGYFDPPVPLNIAELNRCAAGDEVSYMAGPAATLVGVLPPDLGPGVQLEPHWLQAALAAQVAKTCPIDLVLLDDANALAPAGENGSLLRLRVDTPASESQGPAVKLGAAWRLRVYTGSYDPQTEPAFKLGVMHSGVYPVGAPYQPADINDAALADQDLALDELIKRSTTQGLTKAILKD